MLAAQIRATGTIATTATCITSDSQPGSKLCTTPSTGFSMNVPPSAVCGPSGVGTTGTAMSAITEMPK